MHTRSRARAQTCTHTSNPMQFRVSVKSISDFPNRYSQPTWVPLRSRVSGMLRGQVRDAPHCLLCCWRGKDKSARCSCGSPHDHGTFVLRPVYCRSSCRCTT